MKPNTLFKMKTFTTILAVLLFFSKTLMSQNDTINIVLISNRSKIKNVGFPILEDSILKPTYLLKNDSLKISYNTRFETIKTKEGTTIFTEYVRTRSKFRLTKLIPIAENTKIQYVVIDVNGYIVYYFKKKNRGKYVFCLKRVYQFE